MNDNTEHCKMIAENLEAIAEGRAYWDENHDLNFVHEDESIPEDYDQASMWDYFNDVYDIEYRLNAEREFKSVALMVACGGPNIWVDTGNCKVELFWWGDYAYWPISNDVADEIDEVFSEIYSC